MKKHQNVKRNGLGSVKPVRPAALFLSAILALQTVFPAMASWRYEDDEVVWEDMTLDGSFGSSGNMAKNSREDQEEGADKATDSNATATCSNAINSQNILPNGNFEETVSATATADWMWTGKKKPSGWSVWAAASGNKNMSFEIVEDGNEAYEGTNYLSINSTDKATRLDLNRTVNNIMPGVDYLCTFWVNMEAVEGTGLYVRLSGLKTGVGTETNVESTKIKSGTDGWEQYAVMTKDFSSKKYNGIQIDLFAEYMTGAIALDDIQIVPTYSLILNKKEGSMLTGDILQLEASLSDGFQDSRE